MFVIHERKLKSTHSGNSEGFLFPGEANPEYHLNFTGLEVVASPVRRSNFLVVRSGF